MYLLKKIKILFIVFLALLCQNLFSQINISKNYNILNGLPSNAVRCIFKDSRGLFWIGTENGMCLFDGNKFTTFNTENGLAGNLIWDIVEDKNKNLWIACYGDGVSMYDGKKFTNYTVKDGLVYDAVRTIDVDKENRILLGSENGVSIFKDDKFWNFHSTNLDKKFQVIQFFRKDKKQFLLSRNYGIYEIKFSNQITIDSITKSDQGFKYIEKNQKFLYSTGKGLYLDAVKPNFNINLSKDTRFSSDIVWDFEHTKDGTYLAAWGVNERIGGLLKWDEDTIYDVSRSFDIESSKVWSLYYDEKENYLSVGTLDKGLFIVNLSNPIKYNKIKINNDIIDIEITGNSKWLLTSSGVLKATKNDTIIYGDEYFKKGINDYCKTRSNICNSSKFTKHISKYLGSDIEFIKLKKYNSYIFVSTNAGLFKFSINGSIKEYYPTTIDDFSVLPNGYLLIPKPYSHFYIYPNISESFDYRIYDKLDKNTPVDINDIDYWNGKTFLASRTRGLFIHENNNIVSIANSTNFKEKRITDLAINKAGQIFIANKNGTIFKAETNKDFKIIDTISKNNICGNTILFMECYKDLLIVGTNEGLNVVHNNKIQFLDNSDGLQHRNFNTSIIHDDTLLIGTTNGLYSISLNEMVNIESKRTQVLINKLTINDSINYEIRNNWNDTVKNELVLPYNHNSIKIELNTDEVYKNKKVELKYKINNSGWKELNDLNIYLNNLQNGHYQLSIAAKNKLTGTITYSSLLKFEITKPFWETYWFWFLNFSSIAITTLLIYKRKVRRIKEQEKLKTILNDRIVKTRMEALQSQMNPHFTFNAMNSIQNYIIDSNIDDALMYMAEFSKLIRQTLEHSTKQYLTLNQEIDYLKTYCSLENMRYANNVDISFDYEKIDKSKERIPPMLIQPLIENAFIHAFTESDKKYTLSISFSKKENFIYCRVTDNGKGYISKSSSGNNSKAIKIIEERLRLINSKEGDFIIESNSTGTTSTIKIPIITV